MPPPPDMQDDARPFPQLQVLAFCLGDNAGLHNPWLAAHLGAFIHLWCPEVMDRPLPKLVSSLSSRLLSLLSLALSLSSLQCC